MTAAGRAITAAEPGDWHWQIRTHLHQLALVTSEKYPVADHKTLLGQLIDMPAHCLPRRMWRESRAFNPPGPLAEPPLALTGGLDDGANF